VSNRSVPSDVIKGRGTFEVRERRWRRFVERDFGAPQLIGAIEVARTSLYAMIREHAAPPSTKKQAVADQRQGRGRGPRWRGH